MNVLDIQRRLKAVGHSPGALDGVWGPATRRAVISFQRSVGLDADGVVGPKTIAALNAQSVAGGPGQPVPPILTVGEPIWVLEGRRKLGLHESNPALKKWLASDGGKTLGDPEKLPWCGDFVQTCLALTLPEEAQPANPYLARNWLKFGVACPEPVVGAVAVFSRPPSKTSGHVGFVVGADSQYLSILGGNQSNSITVSRISRTRLLGCRWPKSAGAIAVVEMPGATGAITTNEA